MKEVENGKSTKNMRIPHILRTLSNFFSIFGVLYFRASFEHLLSVMNLFKQYQSHMKSQKNFKTSKKWRMGSVRRM